MAYPGHYVHGDYRAVCDVCGQTYLASQMKMRWDNLFCCQEDWEVRHPLDFVRAIPDDMSVPIPRPPPADTFVDPEEEVIYP